MRLKTIPIRFTGLAIGLLTLVFAIGQILGSSFGVGETTYEVWSNGTVSDVAAGDDNLLVVWSKNKNVYGHLIDENGQPVGSRITIYTNLVSGTSPQVAFNGNKYLVIWRGSSVSDALVFGQLISKSGALQGERILVGSSGTHFSVAASGNKFAVAQNSSNAQFSVLIINNNGSLGNSVFLSTNAISVGSNGKSIAGTDNNFMAVFIDQSTKVVTARRVDQTGNTIGGAITLGVRGGVGFQSSGIISVDNTYFVHWPNVNIVQKLRRFAPNGNALGTTTLTKQQIKVFPGAFFAYQAHIDTGELTRINKSNGQIVGTPSPPIGEFGDNHIQVSHLNGKSIVIFKTINDKIRAANLGLIDDIAPQFVQPVIDEFAGEWWSLDEILQARKDSKHIFTITRIKDNKDGVADNWGVRRLWGCVSNNTADRDSWAEHCSTIKTVLLNYNFPYPHQVNNAQVMSKGYPRVLYKAFSLSDGDNYLNLQVLDGEATVEPNDNYLSVKIKFDQYAPCDGPSHACGIEIRDTATGENRTIISHQENGLATSVVNSLDFSVDLDIEEAVGSRINSTGSHNNLRLVLARHEGTDLKNQADGNITTAIDNLRDRSCSSAAAAQDESGTPLYPDGVFRTGGPWHSFRNERLIMAYTTGPSGAMTISSDMGDAYGKTLRAAFQGLLGANGSQAATDGTIYIFVCAKDNAGNWTRFIEPGQSVILHDEQMDTYKGPGAVDLYEFDPTTAGKNKAGTKINAYLPPLTHRVYVDGPAADAGCSPASDPCSIVELDPKPDFVRPSENEVYMAFSPAGYTTSQFVTVGIKLPDDASGIAGVFYKLGAAPGANTQGTFVPASSYAPCNNVLAANGKLASPGWVDVCFIIQASQQDQLHVWLKDNAGNIGTVSSIQSRFLFNDINAPTTPSNLRLLEDPIINARPKLTWNNSLDTNGGVIDKYLLCFWPQNELFTNDDLQNPQFIGRCPSFTAVGAEPEDILSVEAAYTAGGNSSYYWPESVAGLPLGRWNATVIGFDAAGNASGHGFLLPLIISDGKGRLDFTSESSDFAQGGISPRKGSTGNYTFKVRYTDYDDEPPRATQLWIDLDGDGDYQANEKINMASETLPPDSGESQNVSIDITDASNEEEIREYEKALAQNGKYYDGEDYTLEVKLDYIRATKGLVKYRFVFANKFAAALDGEDEGDPTTDNFVKLDPYNLNSFAGQLEVRNNVQRPRTAKKPTILIKEPPCGVRSKINVSVYTVRGRLVRSLLKGRRYSSIERFIRWNLRDKSGKRVDNGLYYVVLHYCGGQRSFKKVWVQK